MKRFAILFALLFCFLPLIRAEAQNSALILLNYNFGGCVTTVHAWGVYYDPDGHPQNFDGNLPFFINAKPNSSLYLFYNYSQYCGGHRYLIQNVSEQDNIGTILNGAVTNPYTTRAAGSSSIIFLNGTLNDDAVFVTACTWPNIICPEPKVVHPSPGLCGAYVQYPAAAAASVNGPSNIISVYYSHPSGSFFPVGTTTVTVTATDDCVYSNQNGVFHFQASCSFTVTVLDEDDPVIANLPQDISVPTDPGNCSAVVSWTPPTASDCSGIASLTPNIPPGATFPKGATIVTYTATDGAGHTTSASFTVTVHDGEAPVLTNMPASMTIPVEAGICSAVAQWTPPGVWDNCPGAWINYNQEPGDRFPVGSTTVVYTATDAAGNTSAGTFVVTVADNQAPALTLSLSPALLWPPNHSLASIHATVTVSDNCSVSWFLKSITSSEADNGLGDGDRPNDIQEAAYNTADLDFKLRAERAGNGPGRTYTVIYEALDASGNATDVPATVTVPHSAPKESAQNGSDALPKEILLEQNHPNPFNPSTTIRYALPERGHVRLRVYDFFMREVATLVDGEQEAGTHSALFDATSLPCGSDYYRLESGSAGLMRRMSLAK